MAPEPAPSGRALASADEDLRRALEYLIERHGRALNREPQRLEAMLRDLCPVHRREIFLLVAAVKEQVVSEILLSLDVLPDDIVAARAARRLQDGLGLSEESARWAVSMWLPAVRMLAVMPDLPPKLDLAPSSLIAEKPGAGHAFVPILDWKWLALCAAAVCCSAIGLTTVAYVGFYHAWSTLRGWAVETGMLSLGLGTAAGGLMGVKLGLAGRAAPNHRGLGANAAAAAMLLETAVLLALPLFVVAGPVLWAGEWIFELHIQGQAHELSFQLGRITQSLLLAAALVVWVRSMVEIQGRIASSLIRLR
jgi:hypothetical protein